MCIAGPARVVAVGASDATVDVDGVLRRASRLRVSQLEPGDWVLVAAGMVLRRIDATEAADLAALLRSAMPAVPLVAAPTTGDLP